MIGRSLEVALYRCTIERAAATPATPSARLRSQLWRALRQTGWTPTEPLRARPAPAHLSDEALWQRFRDGDPAGFDDLMRRHLGVLVGYATRKLDSPAQAEDAVQETFLVLFRKAADIDPRDDGVRRYLFGVLNYQLKRARASQLRAQYRHSQLCAEHPEHPEYGNIAHRSDDTAAWRALLQQHDTERLARALDAVCHPLDQAILILASCDQSGPEIAAKLDLSEACVRTRKHRALRKLRAYLAREPS